MLTDAARQGGEQRKARENGGRKKKEENEQTEKYNENGECYMIREHTISTEINQDCAQISKREITKINRLDGSVR